VTGNEYADLIASYLLRNYAARGVSVYREVMLGRTIIGKNRHIDIFVVHPGTERALAIECKYQDSNGTVDEKIPYAIEDLRVMGMPVCLAYAGSGFSPGILHLLAASPIAAYCLPSEPLQSTRETRELDIALAMAFQWWDIVVSGRNPFDPTRVRRRSIEPSE
jgi:hypothetical protein